MGFLGLLGKDRSTVVNGAVKVVENVISMVDKRKFTPQEASEFNLKTVLWLTYEMEILLLRQDRG